MTTLKVLRDTDTAEPSRIKYDGEFAYAGFNVIQPAGGTVATLDCVGSYEIHDGDDMAFVDMDELQHAVELVEEIAFVDAVEVLEVFRE